MQQKPFQLVLADFSAYGKVQHVRSDDGVEFREGELGDLCRERGIRQEFTSENSPRSMT